MRDCKLKSPYADSGKIVETDCVGEGGLAVLRCSAKVRNGSAPRSIRINMHVEKKRVFTYHDHVEDLLDRVCSRTKHVQVDQDTWIRSKAYQP